MGYTDTPKPKSRPTKVSPFDPCKMILCFIEKRLVQAKSSVGTAVRCGTQGAYISAPCFLLLNYLPGKSQADIGVSSCKSRFFSAVNSSEFRFSLEDGCFIRFLLKVGQTAKFCPTSASWTIRTIKTINQTAIFSSYLSYLTYSLSELSISKSYLISTFLMLFSLYDLK